MASGSEILRLCRLCLTKDEVNIPIFEDVNDISQVFLKISACLPVKVSRNDKLPKKICDSCSYKLGLFYEFLNTSTASEKQLLTWVNQPSIEKPVSKVVNTLTSSHAANGNSMILKQEVPELLDVLSIDEISPSRDLNLPSEAQDYVLQQQQLPYDSVEFEFQQDEFVDTTSSVDTLTTNNAITLSSSCKRGAAVLKVLPDDFGSEEESDLRVVTSKMAKTETGNRNDKKHMPVVDLPSTSDNNQPGPSGLGKPDADAPVTFLTYGQLAVFTKKKDTDFLYSEDHEKENTMDDNSIDSFSFYDSNDNLDEYQVVNIMQAMDLNGTLKCNSKSKPNPSKKRYSLCSVCGKYVSILEKHMRLSHGNHKCNICITAFKSEHDLQVHKELHEDNEYPCSECPLSFKKALDYAYHSKEHCGSKTYSCPLCHFRTPSRGSVKIHIQHHEKDYKFTCEICNRGFISNSVYTEHVEGHAGIKRFQCEICLKKFLYKRYLMVHRKLNHKKILEGYEDINECHVCQRKFSFEKSLVRHLSKIHSIGRDVSVDCPICNKKIANPYNLKMHMRTHTGEKPYVCETCGKAFTKRVNLKRHLHNLHY